MEQRPVATIATRVRRLRGLAGARIGCAAGALVLAGCGASSMGSPRGSAAFAWLALGHAPAAWSPGEVAGGMLPRPPGWRPFRGDPGTVSFAQLGAHGQLQGYLNATPRSGAETLGNWTSFRVAHNAEEGDRGVRALQGADDLRLGDSRASCVIDDYLTGFAPANRYREVACLLTTPRGTTAVVGAAPPADWDRQRPILERAIAAFLAS